MVLFQGSLFHGKLLSSHPLTLSWLLLRARNIEFRKKREKNKVKCELTLIRGKKPRVYIMQVFDFKALNYLSLWINLFGKRVCFLVLNYIKEEIITKDWIALQCWIASVSDTEMLFLWERKLLGIVLKSQICIEPWNHRKWNQNPVFKSSSLTWSLIIIWIGIIQILNILKSFAMDFGIE